MSVCLSDYFVAGAAGACAGVDSDAGVVSAAGLVSSLGAMALSMHPATAIDNVATSSRAANKARVFLILVTSFPFMNVHHFRNYLNNQRKSANFAPSEGFCIHENEFMNICSLLKRLSNVFLSEPDTFCVEMKGRVMISSAKRKELKVAKQWAFLTNHALVLLFVTRHRRITARELSLEVGVTERAVQTIIADLEEAGYLQKSREGRTMKYDVNRDMPMRHPTQQNVAVGDFLETLRTSPISARNRSD